MMMRCSYFNESTQDSERAVRKMELSFRMRNVSSSVFLTCLTTPYEKCDTTGQMNDIRLSLVNVLLML